MCFGEIQKFTEKNIKKYIDVNIDFSYWIAKILYNPKKWIWSHWKSLSWHCRINVVMYYIIVTNVKCGKYYIYYTYLFSWKQKEEISVCMCAM